MIYLYNIGIYLYLFGIRIVSLFNEKARKWVEGRKDIFVHLEAAFGNSVSEAKNRIAWFHCASLGEFEQGRPVIEEFRTRFQDYKILLTFFSPSGYGVRKNYENADYVFYLPIDTKKNAERFVNLVRPDIAFFVKYEYWYNYLRILEKTKVPIYFFSAIFRPDQYFFKWYGTWFRKQLKLVKWFFLQDEESAQLLEKTGIHSFSVTGDTRFDRVNTVINHVHKFPLIEKFIGNSKIVVAGSTWPEDEEILVQYITDGNERVKYIIAPHETDQARIKSIIAKLPFPAIRFSELNNEPDWDAKILVIDCIGILPQLYQYAFLALIGGGFGAGIHNILEAAGFGVPVVFGPNYQKFKEARDLISMGAVYSISNYDQFKQVLNQLLNDPDRFSKASNMCRKYVDKNKGSKDKIMEKIDV